MIEVFNSEKCKSRSNSLLENSDALDCLSQCKFHPMLSQDAIVTTTNLELHSESLRSCSTIHGESYNSIGAGKIVSLEPSFLKKVQ